MLTYSYKNQWLWVLLFVTSFTANGLSWIYIHHAATAALPLVITHALLLPLALCWMIQGILLCQPNGTLFVAACTSLHSLYLLTTTPSFLTLLGLITFLLFLGLALHTFNFSWAILPRHIIETTLLYAPEMGFLSTQYDILIDEIGYNAWYATYRLPWLIAIGLCWAILLLISWWSLFFGIILTLFYLFLSSTLHKALIKILSLYLPAAGLVLLYSFITKQTLILPSLVIPSLELSMLYQLPHQIIELIFPALSILQTTPHHLATHALLLFSVGFDLFCLIGFLGTCAMLFRKNYALSQASKVLPFYLVTLVATLYDTQSPLFWMHHILLLILGSLFWYEQGRKIWPNFFSE